MSFVRSRDQIRADPKQRDVALIMRHNLGQREDAVEAQSTDILAGTIWVSATTIAP